MRRRPSEPIKIIGVKPSRCLARLPTDPVQGKIDRKTQTILVITGLELKIRALAGAAIDQLDKAAWLADARDSERRRGQRRDMPVYGGGRRLAARPPRSAGSNGAARSRSWPTFRQPVAAAATAQRRVSSTGMRGDNVPYLSQIRRARVKDDLPAFGQRSVKAEA